MRPKARLLVCGMALLLALAGGFAFMALRLRESAAPVPVVKNASDAVRTLMLHTADELLSVSVRPFTGEPYELAVEEGGLYLVAKEGRFAVDSSFQSDLLGAFTQLVVQDTVAEDATEVAEQLSDMGLSPALASAVLRFRDGHEETIEVGAEVPYTTYSYYRWSGDDGVHMCDVGVADVFHYTAEHLLPFAQVRVEPSLVETLSIRNGSGECVYSFQSGASGCLESPFHYPLSDDGAASLLTALQSFRLGIYQSVAMDESRAAYGLDHPLCVLTIRQKAGSVNDINDSGQLVTVQRPASTLCITLGRLEGDSFYTCEYNGACYLVSRFLAEGLVQADPAAFLTRAPADPGRETLTRISIHTPALDADMAIRYQERVLPNNELELDANGNAVCDTLVFINGEAAEPSRLDLLLERLCAFTVAGSLPADYALSADASPRWTLTLEGANGFTRLIEAYRMDAFTDAIALDGVLCHYAHQDAMDALVTGWLP